MNSVLGYKKSRIGHSTLPYNCPHTPAIVLAILSKLDPQQFSSSSCILDVGCGRGEFLCNAVERFGCRGVGVDMNSEMLAKIRKPATGTIETVVMEMGEWLAISANTSRKYDAVVCIGSLQPDKTTMIQQLSRLLNSGGYLILGELVWVKEPTPNFLEHLGMSKSDHFTAAALEDTLSSNQLSIVPIGDGNVMLQSLSEYETTLNANIARWASSSLQGVDIDPDVQAIVTKAREWHQFSSQYAWDTWEFATVVCRQQPMSL
jgi:ubiquinone/menaquinone biosynthesis C-methylase UbiE